MTTPPLPATQNRLRLAIQKSGRLADDSNNLLKQCGLSTIRSKNRLLCRVCELPIDLLLVRDDDIPALVNNGICDLGIVGENVYAETGATPPATPDTPPFAATILQRLGVSKCRLSLATRKNTPLTTARDLEGMTIATTYPNLVQQFLKQRGITAKTLFMSGSVEIAPDLEIADAICDIVASGATLAANNLTESFPILECEALLIKSPWPLDPQKKQTVNALLARLASASNNSDYEYIPPCLLPANITSPIEKMLA